MAILVEPAKYIMETTGRLPKESCRFFFAFNVVAFDTETDLAFLAGMAPLDFETPRKGEGSPEKMTCVCGDDRATGLLEKDINSFSAGVRSELGSFRKKSTAGIAITKNDTVSIVLIVRSRVMVLFSRLLLLYH